MERRRHDGRRSSLKKTSKVRSTRQKVCPLFWKAWGAVRARTGVGTPFPLRLLAQTPALWRGVIFEGCPTSEVWKNPYIIVYVYFRDRKLLRPGTPRRPAKVDKTLRGGMPGATAPRSPFRLKELKRLGSDPDATVIFLVGNRMKRKTSDKTDMERRRHDGRRSGKKNC